MPINAQKLTAAVAAIRSQLSLIEAELAQDAVPALPEAIELFQGHNLHAAYRTLAGRGGVGSFDSFVKSRNPKMHQRIKWALGIDNTPFPK